MDFYLVVYTISYATGAISTEIKEIDDRIALKGFIAQVYSTPNATMLYVVECKRVDYSITKPVVTIDG